MSNIVLNTLTYVGQGLVNGVGQFWNRQAGLAALFKSLTNGQSSSKEKIVVSWKLTVPYTAEPVEGCCEATEYLPTIADVRFSFDKKVPKAHRTDIRLQIKDLLATAQCIDSIDDLTPQV